MSGEATALLLLVSSVGLASGIAAATSLALYILISVLAVLFIFFASVSAWRLLAKRSSPARQMASSSNSILVALGGLFGCVKATPSNSIIIHAHGLFGGVLRQPRSAWCLGAIAQGGGHE